MVLYFAPQQARPTRAVIGGTLVRPVARFVLFYPVQEGEQLVEATMNQTEATHPWLVTLTMAGLGLMVLVSLVLMA